jgi:hypothetical protein
MHLIYIDDSFEKPRQIYSAIAVPAGQWRAFFGLADYENGTRPDPWLGGEWPMESRWYSRGALYQP